ncbi:MAG: TRAP transporter small permease subunit [Deltaproteobacteria bacterium]|nr:TRAP transporter small permease subunit [Deltaproteobacteria bacterium]
MKRVIDRVSAVLMAFEKAVMLAALLGMLVAVAVAIGARPLGIDVPWVTPLVLALMIVSTFAGAALATATRRHISMDLMSKLLKNAPRAVVSMLTSLLGAALSTALAIAGGHWVKANMEFDDPISLALKVPDWWLQAVVPAGFVLCALHFVLNALLDGRALATGDYSHLVDQSAAAHGVTSMPAGGAPQ